jgi:putative hemolysin
VRERSLLSTAEANSYEAEPPPLLGAAPDAGPLAQSGHFEVRLAATPADLLACQRLRYSIFYEELSARPTPEEAAERRDFDAYDEVCDHLMVVNTQAPGGRRLVGTYRLLLQERAERGHGFYTSGEYDLSPFFAPCHAGLKFLELGRSCVHRDFRTKPVVDLLWRGIGRYVGDNDVDVMFGCGSFPGRSPDDHAEALTYLYRHHLAPPEWCARALPARYEPLDRMPGQEIDPKKGFRGLPPIIRGYIRAGAYVGDGAVIDQEFGTVDALIIFPVDQVKERYYTRFGLDTEG